MKSHNPKAIADKFYGDPFSRKIREGKRCCLFGPSIFKSAYGGAQLLIDKETLTRYEIYSGMMRFGELPFLDYENQLGLFTWPSEGGRPIADEDKILSQQITNLKQTNWQTSAENIKLLVALLDQQATSNLKLKDANFANIEKLFHEAINIQMQHPKLFANSSQTALDHYLYQLKIKGRISEKQDLESKWTAAIGGNVSPPSQAANEVIAEVGEVAEVAEVVEVVEETSNFEAEQLLFDAADAEDAKNLKLAEELYRKAIALLLEDPSNVSRDQFVMLSYSALGQMLVTQEQFLSATEPLASSVAFFQASQHQQELMLSATVCIQLLGECFTELGRTEELAALARVMDEARK